MHYAVEPPFLDAWVDLAHEEIDLVIKESDLILTKSSYCIELLHVVDTDVRARHGKYCPLHQPVRFFCSDFSLQGSVDFEVAISEVISIKSGNVTQIDAAFGDDYTADRIPDGRAPIQNVLIRISYAVDTRGLRVGAKHRH